MKSLISLLIMAFSLCGFSQVGIGTTTPRSTLDINGNLSLKVSSYNGGTVGTPTDINDGIYINLTPTTGNLAFLLPDAATYPGRIYILRNITDTLDAQIYSTGGAFFSGDSRIATTAPITMTPDTGGDGGDVTKTLIFISDGVNWTYGQLGF